MIRAGILKDYVELGIVTTSTDVYGVPTESITYNSYRCRLEYVNSNLTNENRESFIRYSVKVTIRKTNNTLDARYIRIDNKEYKINQVFRNNTEITVIADLINE